MNDDRPSCKGGIHYVMTSIIGVAVQQNCAVIAELSDILLTIILIVVIT